MALQSMTGFARLDGRSGRHQWAWELRSVNGKGLDVRLRLPQGFERLETEAEEYGERALSAMQLKQAVFDNYVAASSRSPSGKARRSGR